MKTKNLFIALLFIIVACDKTSSDSPPLENVAVDTPIITTPDTGTQNPTISEEFMELVNNHRQSLGREPLILDEGMSQIVQAHSNAMASGSVAFGHTGFSTRCSNAKGAIGGGNLCGENVASGQKSAQAVFTSWMNSSGHRANIEQGRYTHCGFALAKSSSGTIYWTHLFLEKN